VKYPKFAIISSATNWILINMTDNYDGFTLRKRLGMGYPLPEGNFGVESLKSVQGEVGTGKTLKDGERGAGPPIDGNQANPSHGYK